MATNAVSIVFLLTIFSLVVYFTLDQRRSGPPPFEEQSLDVSG
jgi:hypothetical protein